MLRLFFAICLIALSALPTRAVQPDEVLSDPVMEQRARDLSAKLRCLVCQNQSIDDSDAPLARDLRLRLRERLTAGDSDGEAMEYLVARYGEFILLKPRLGPHTLLLWAGPFVLLLLGALMLARRRRRSGVAPLDKPLSAEEIEKLSALLKQDE